jgi:hypothetical protein
LVQEEVTGVVVIELDVVLELDDVDITVLLTDDDELVAEDELVETIEVAVETGVDEEEVTAELVVVVDGAVVGLEEVVATVEGVEGLLVRATYAPAPATTMITTTMIANTAGAIPLLDRKINYELFTEEIPTLYINFKSRSTNSQVKVKNFEKNKTSFSQKNLVSSGNRLFVWDDRSKCPKNSFQIFSPRFNTVWT